MTGKEQIIKILLDTLCYAYCDNCGCKTDEECGVCYRKYQNWRLGESTAAEIADKILLVVNKTPIKNL